MQQKERFAGFKIIIIYYLYEDVKAEEDEGGGRQWGWSVSKMVYEIVSIGYRRFYPAIAYRLLFRDIFTLSTVLGGGN